MWMSNPLRVGKWTINLLFEPRDLWIGVYCKEAYWEMGTKCYPFYVGVLPMCLLLFTYYSEPPWD